MGSLTVTMPTVNIRMKLNASPSHKLCKHSWVRHLGVEDVKTLRVWRACFVEMMCVGVFVFSSIIISTGTKFQFSSPHVAIAFFHFLMFTVLLRAAIPPSDAHLNPAVSLCAVFAGIYSPLRGFMYIAAQSVGSILGAICAKTLLPVEEVNTNLLSGCRYKDAVAGLSGNQAFLAEFLFSFILIYIVFMVCIDQKQFQSIGLEKVPLFVGMVTGFNIYVSGIIAPGYGGAYMNPSRCTGPAVVYGGGELLSCLWLFWCAPGLAAAVVAALYRVIPPDHRQRVSSGNLPDQDLNSRLRGFGNRSLPLAIDDQPQPGGVSSVGDRSTLRDDQQESIKSLY